MRSQSQCVTEYGRQLPINTGVISNDSGKNIVPHISDSSGRTIKIGENQYMLMGVADCMKSSKHYNSYVTFTNTSGLY